MEEKCVAGWVGRNLIVRQCETFQPEIISYGPETPDTSARI